MDCLKKGPHSSRAGLGLQEGECTNGVTELCDFSEELLSHLP